MPAAVPALGPLLLLLRETLADPAMRRLQVASLRGRPFVVAVTGHQQGAAVAECVGIERLGA